MRPDSVFAAAYAIVLIAISAGLHRLGRVSTDAWRSRALAGHRRATSDPLVAAPVADWPHSEVPRLHTGIALVAASAATLLTTVELLRHHRPVEVVVLGAVLLLGCAAVIRLAARLR